MDPYRVGNGSADFLDERGLALSVSYPQDLALVASAQNLLGKVGLHHGGCSGRKEEG